MSASTGRPVGRKFRNTDIRQPKPSPQVQDRRDDSQSKSARTKKGMSPYPPAGLDKYKDNRVGQMKKGDTFGSRGVTLETKRETRKLPPSNKDPRFGDKRERDKETNRETSRVRNDMRNGRKYDPKGRDIGPAEGDY